MNNTTTLKNVAEALALVPDVYLELVDRVRYFRNRNRNQHHHHYLELTDHYGRTLVLDFENKYVHQRMSQADPHPTPLVPFFWDDMFLQDTSSETVADVVQEWFTSNTQEATYADFLAASVSTIENPLKTFEDGPEAWPFPVTAVLDQLY